MENTSYMEDKTDISTVHDILFKMIWKMEISLCEMSKVKVSV